MKKMFLVLFVFSLNVIINGQLMSSYGVKVGYGITNHSWENPSTDFKLDWDNNTGIAVKVFADMGIPVLSFLQVEGELGYAKKGASYEVEYTTVDRPDGNGLYRTMNDHLDYLTLSLLAKVKFSPGMFSPYLIAGPEYNYLLNQKNDLDPAGIYKLKKSAFGLSAGVGSEIKLLLISVLVEYRYSWDLSDNSSVTGLNVKNYSHTFLVGIKL